MPHGAFMPPNGFAGLAQQTTAVQSLYRRGRGGTSKRRKSRKKSAAKGAVRRVAKRASSSRTKGRLKKGSAAAKAYMAKIRRKRR